jgi:hypothetical protein
MKLWISKIFLLTGIVLLLLHNLAAHHHDDDYSKHIVHHDNDALDHLQIDHIFSSQIAHFDEVQAIIADIEYNAKFNFIQFPVALYLKPVIIPDEPYPLGWFTDKTILRGPPFKLLILAVFTA